MKKYRKTQIRFRVISACHLSSKTSQFMSPECSTVHNDRTFDIINDKNFDKYKLFIKHDILVTLGHTRKQAQKQLRNIRLTFT